MAGGFYMLPQFRAALDVRQGALLGSRCRLIFDPWVVARSCALPVSPGRNHTFVKMTPQSDRRQTFLEMAACLAGVVLCHRSGDAEVGLHGNSEMWQPNPQVCVGYSPPCAAAHSHIQSTAVSARC